MPVRFRRLALLPPLALLPLLARADPWNALGAYYEMLFIGGLVLLTLLTATVVLVVLSYQRPARHGLYVAQLALLVINALAGIALLPLQHELLPLGINPCWQLVLPLGLWLNGVRWARQAQTVTWQRRWLGVAVASLGLLLLVLPSLLLSGLLQSHRAALAPGLVRGLYLALDAAATLGAWALARWQLRGQLPAAAWLPWWLPALLVAVLGAIHAVFTLWFSYAFTNTFSVSAAALLRIGAEDLLVNWVLSVLALALLRPARYAAPASPADQATHTGSS